MSIRLRLALVAGVVSGVVLALAGALELRLLDARLDTDVDRALRNRVADVARLVESEGPDTVTGSPRLTFGLGPDARVVVLRRDGRVVAQTRPGSDVLSGRQRAEVVARTSVLSGQREGARPLAFAARRVTLPDGTAGVAVVDSSLRSNRTAIAEARGLMLLGWLPASVAGGLGGWVLAGAALRPVKRLRERAEQLRTTDADVGLPVPRTGDEIEHLARTLDALVRRLHLANQGRQDEFAEIAHELRTPLMALQGELELLERRFTTGGEAHEGVAAARDAAARLAELVERQLLLGTSGRGAALLQLKVAEPLDLLSAAARRHRRAAAQAQVRLETSPDPGTEPAPAVPALVCDPTRVAQILDNLINNSMAVVPAGGSIRLAVAANEHLVAFEVHDSGPGFSGDGSAWDAEESFQRFRRGAAARRAGDAGMGLGLPIVRELALAHGGETELSNHPQGGAVVVVRLPVAGPDRRLVGDEV